MFARHGTEPRRTERRGHHRQPRGECGDDLAVDAGTPLDRGDKRHVCRVERVDVLNPAADANAGLLCQCRDVVRRKGACDGERLVSRLGTHPWEDLRAEPKRCIDIRRMPIAPDKGHAVAGASRWRIVRSAVHDRDERGLAARCALAHHARLIVGDSKHEIAGGEGCLLDARHDVREAIGVDATSRMVRPHAICVEVDRVVDQRALRPRALQVQRKRAEDLRAAEQQGLRRPWQCGHDPVEAGDNATALGA